MITALIILSKSKFNFYQYNSATQYYDVFMEKTVKL